MQECKDARMQGCNGVRPRVTSGAKTPLLTLHPVSDDVWHAACIHRQCLLPARTTIMIDTQSRSTTVETPPPAPSGNVTGLVSGIIDDAQKLMRQQLEMLKSEVREDFKRSKRAAEYGGL